MCSIGHNTAQNSSDIFPLNLQTITIAHMMSFGGEKNKNVQFKKNFVARHQDVTSAINVTFLRLGVCVFSSFRYLSRCDYTLSK